MLSHELRTPLNAIVGWAHMLRSAPLDEEARARAVETIHRNAQLQRQLISDVLDISRIVSGKLTLDLRQVDLAAVIEDAADTLRPAAQARQIGLELELDRAGLSRARRRRPAAAGRLEPALERHQVHGRGRLACACASPAQARPSCAPSRTTAPGWPRSSCRSCSTASGRETRRARAATAAWGSGSPSAAASSSATVARSRPATHPAAGVPSSASACRRWRRQDAAEGASDRTTQPPLLETAPSLRGLCVLVVENDEDSRTLVQGLIELQQGRVLLARSAAEAFQSLQLARPHVVVSDIEMPDEDGYSLLRRVRALPPAQGGLTPAIALTAYARPQDRELALAAGFELHVAKPVDPAELVAAIAALARPGAARRPGPTP